MRAGVAIAAAIAAFMSVLPVGGVVVVAADSAPATTEASIRRIAGPDRVATALAVSRTVFPHAGTAILAAQDDPAVALVAAPLADRLHAPLLLTARDHLSPGIVGELDRLGVRDLVLLGNTETLSKRVRRQVPRRFAVRRVAGRNRVATAAAVADELGPSGVVYVAAVGRFADALAVGPLAAHTQRPVLLTASRGLPKETRLALERIGASRVVVVGGPRAVSDGVVEDLRSKGYRVTRAAGRSRYATAGVLFDAAVAAGLDPREVWLATGGGFADALAAGPAVAASGATLLLVPGHDLRRAPEPVSRLRRHPVRHVRLLGGPRAITRHASWQVPVVRHAALLPRGGLTLFPEFRLVAFYGNAESPAMGVLGEQPPDEAYERLWRQARPYAAGGRPLLPVFELIVSIATAGAGPDGDYSRPTDPALIERWLAAARRHGTYLLLDIQPGRSDFLREVKRYDRFLREPDVGIALDPEWRMDDDEVPGQTIGSVDAAEVNRVVDYVAGIVREERLPQKLFVVHQFRTDMVTNRDAIRRPAELAVVFHMDGHGSRSQKLETYRHVHARPGEGAWNGFKLFYDEDRDMFSAHELLDVVRPVPDLVTYQ